jgi:hypothetical protein
MRPEPESFVAFPHCIKVEFHESGWVHYQAIFLTRRFLPKELLGKCCAGKSEINAWASKTLKQWHEHGVKRRRSAPPRRP